ncbi:MAG: FecR family protein [Planctomycetota bacterium]|nr:FecR family protein [Planctomycetota bacterium]
MPASEGLEVLAGDVVTTEKEGSIGIVFLDSSAVTLRESSTIRIVDYAYPEQKAPTHLSLESGRVFFDIRPRPQEAHFFIRTVAGDVEVKGTKFEVWSTPDGSDFKTIVSVKKGKVAVTPTGSTSVDILDGIQAILHIKNINIAGLTGGIGELTKGNIPKDQVKLLDATALCDVEVSVKDKKGSAGVKKAVQIKSWNRNPDGTKTYIKLTEIDTDKVRMTTIVKNQANKVVSRINESRGRVRTNSIEGNLSIRQRLSDGAGVGMVRDTATRKLYRGSVITMADGTVITDCKAKDGSRIVITRLRLLDGTIITTKTTFEPGATQGTQFTEMKRRDGLRRTFLETVSTIQLPNGDFQSLSGMQEVQTIPKLPPGAPEKLSNSAIVIPDTTTPGAAEMGKLPNGTVNQQLLELEQEPSP